MSQRRNKRNKHSNRENEGGSRRRFSFQLSKGQKRKIALVAAVVLLLGASCMRSIIELKAENRELQQQQQELEQEKSRLTKELKNINSKDYIQEQAREKLRLLNKDEILFIFKDEGDDGNN